MRKLVGRLGQGPAVARIRLALPVCATLLLLDGCGGMGAKPHTAELTPQGQSMERMLADVNLLRGFIYGTGSRADAQDAATDLVAWSKQMGTLFPPGQTSYDYVDMSPERTRAAPEAMHRTAEQLLSAVQFGQRTTVGDRLAQAERDGCGACHLSLSP